VGVRVGHFKNPIYCPNPPPADPTMFFWRGRDGFVHDRHGNKWDPSSKLLLEAGSGEPTLTEAPGGSGSRSSRRPSSPDGRRQRRDSGGHLEQAASGRDGDRRPGSSQQQQQQGRDGSSRPAAGDAASSLRQPGGASSRPSPGQQHAYTPLGGGAPGASMVSPFAGNTPAGGTPGVGLPGSAVLPEELDVDMEVDEPPPPQLPTVPDLSGGAGQRRQPGTRQFGAAAVARRGAAAADKQQGAAATPPPPAAPAAAAATQGAAAAREAPAAATPPPPAAGPGGGAAVAAPAVPRADDVADAQYCYAEYPTVALQALQHNLSTLDTPSFK
jgi:hypothetical protein